MSVHEQNPLHLHALRLLYLLMFSLSLYLISVSRSGEAYTVWEVMHPAFIPMFFVTTFLLLAIIFSSQKAKYKLLFVILHSILSHSFFVIIFPAGNVGVQQVMLGKTRLMFDNIMHHGFGWTYENVLLKIYVLFRGENLQIALGVVFARIFGVDVYWSHLLLIPLLWGVFVPIIAFMISKTLGASEKISALSSLLVSLFPANIIWGAVSIPNGLSYLFFLCFIFFLLRYLKSNRAKDLLLVATFFFASFLSHYLAGTMALSLLILASSIRKYKEQKASSPTSARLMLMMSFIFCASIMPFALVYRRSFYPWENTYFSLQKLCELPSTGKVLSLLLGSYFDLISREAYISILILGLAPLLGFIGMISILLASVKKTRKTSINPSLLFLSLGLLMVVVDDRIVKYFMIDVPFVEFERLWLFRDFLLVSFLALVIGATFHEMRAFFGKLSERTLAFLRKKFSERLSSKAFSSFTLGHLRNSISLGSFLAYLTVLTIVSAWVTASVYVAYPSIGPLQTTSYELEAVRHIQETTEEKYIVIADQWIIFAGQMFVGINNPQAFYFSHRDPSGVSLFIKMKSNPSNETLIEAMKINNATTAYFIIVKPRLSTGEYIHIIQQAEQNGLQTYPDGIFYYNDEEKLRIFYYQSQSFE